MPAPWVGLTVLSFPLIACMSFAARVSSLSLRRTGHPHGIDAKARITARFLQRKEAEYAALQAEIARLRAEVNA